MAKMTLMEMNLHYFEAHGAKEIPSRNKYRMMEMKFDNGHTGYFFLGSNGAIRFGTGKAADKSFSVTGKYVHKVKAWCESVGHI